MAAFFSSSEEENPSGYDSFFEDLFSAYQLPGKDLIDETDEDLVDDSLEEDSEDLNATATENPLLEVVDREDLAPESDDDRVIIEGFDYITDDDGDDDGSSDADHYSYTGEAHGE